MPRLREVGRGSSDNPIVDTMFDVVFGEGVDPLRESTSSGSNGDWWTVFALVPDVLEHAVEGFVLYRSPTRVLDPVLRELAMTRVGWAAGSTFVYSQHCRSLTELGVDRARIDAVASWPVSDLFDEIERGVLAYADGIAFDHGRVSDEVFAVLQRHLPDDAILELTYLSAMYLQHAVVSRALRLEWDDRADPVRQIEPPEPTGAV